MTHVVALSYLYVDLDPGEPPPAPTEITLLEEPPPAPPPREPRPPKPPPTDPPDGPERSPKRKPRAAGPEDGISPPASGPRVGPAPTGAGAGAGSGVQADLEGPPGPPHAVVPPSFFPRFTPDEEEEEDEDGLTVEREVRRPEPRKPVAPVIGQLDSSVPGTPDPPANERGSQASGDGRTGGGITFDFWAPDDFNEEMARAEAKIRPREEALEKARDADLGHGIICNTRGSWFICDDDEIGACNERHDEMCRYAKGSERMEILSPVIFQ